MDSNNKKLQEHLFPLLSREINLGHPLLEWGTVYTRNFVGTGTVTVPTPVNSTDAVTKAYADALVGALPTVEEVDGVPSLTGTTVIRFDQVDGFVVSQPGAGIARLDLSFVNVPNDVTAGGRIFSADGTRAAPGIAFTADTDLGLFRLGADTVGLAASTGPILRLVRAVDANGLQLSYDDTVGVVRTTNATALQLGTNSVSKLLVSASDTDPVFTLQNSGIGSITQRFITNAATRWDIRIPSGTTRLEFFDNTAVRLALYNGGIVAVGSGSIVSAESASLVLARGAAGGSLRATNNADTGTVLVANINTSDQIIIGGGGALVNVGSGTPVGQLRAGASAAGTIALVADTAASPTVGILSLRENATERFAFAPHNQTAAAPLTLASFDAGDGQYGRHIILGRNSNGTNTGAGHLILTNKGGTAYSLWVDNTGALRYGTSQPTNANDTSGTNITSASGAVTVLDRVTSNTTVANTTTETTVYTKSIDANTLGTTKRLRLKLQLRASDNSGSTVNASITFRLKYGATTLASSAYVTRVSDGVTSDAILADTAVVYEGLLSADGATNAQIGHQTGLSTLKFFTGATLQTSIIGAVGSGRGTAAEDSTQAKTLVVTVQWSHANAGSTVTMEHAVLTLE